MRRPIDRVIGHEKRRRDIITRLDDRGNVNADLTEVAALENMSGGDNLLSGEADAT